MSLMPSGVVVTEPRVRARGEKGSRPILRFDYLHVNLPFDGNGCA